MHLFAAYILVYQCFFIWIYQKWRWEYSERTHGSYKSEHLAIGMEQTDKRNTVNGGQMQVNGRGYTHSIVVGVALREPSCQFSTGTGMQVSLMVSWQRKDRGGPLSSSSWELLWTVSTTGGGGGVEGAEVRGWGVESHVGRYDDRRPREEGGKKTRKTQKHMKQEQLNMRQESRVKPLFEPTSYESQLLVSHISSHNTNLRL